MLAMDAMRPYVERFAKSFGFSLILFVLWGGLATLRARFLLGRFALLECAWILYSATIAVLFLFRSRPSIVSLIPCRTCRGVT